MLLLLLILWQCVNGILQTFVSIAGYKPQLLKHMKLLYINGSGR